MVVGSNKDIWKFLVSLFCGVKNKYILVLVVKIVGIVVKGYIVN